ncbi:hypothetical protein NP493_13g06024 [Ridgeia piscesae]|uniref:Transcription initiation factor TFIID subunit 5 n=1 Tax=Ridgeia piscesae TaxID=27915 RepID=A0AAD9PEZ6_RIDPI|nr:hypothetical protein NP493_13g06024 [Ridgeia piscesae]
MAAIKQEIEGKKDGITNKDTLLAVLKFLKENNLKGTEELLLKEANVKDEDLKQQDQSDVSSALAAYKSESDPSVYEEYYTSLKTFIESSLDVHKCELSMVLYPVFVQMYLELVYNNHEGEAIAFFEKFNKDQESYYEEDLKQLFTVTKAEHMARNQLMENFKSSEFTLRMSRDSYNHLKRYLLDKKHTVLLNIIQEHLFIDVYDGVPRTKLQIDSTAGGVLGEARRDANKAKVYYGLMKEPDINIPLDDDDGETEGEDKPKKKKPKKDLLLSRKTKNDPNAPPMNRIPLPEVKDHHKLEKVKSLKESLKRVSVAPDHLPSICFYTFLNSYSGVTSVDITEDSSTMSAGFSDSYIRVFSLNQSKLRCVKQRDALGVIDPLADDVLERMMDDRTATVYKTLLGHSGMVCATSFNPDRSFMLSSSTDGTIRLWSTATWTNLVCYKGHNYPVWDVKFGPYGHYFVSGGHDNTARLWSTDHYQPLRLFAGHLADIDTVRFHPNSCYVATGSTDRTVRLWDVHSGSCVRIMTGHKAPIHTLEFSPDGRYIASAGVDQVILLWDVASGELAGQLKGHTGTIYSLAYSREGATLASGACDNTVKLWDVNKLLDDQDGEGITTANLVNSTSYEIGSYPTKSTPVLSLHFTRRNLLLAAGPYVP